jgi:hypothetical protein
MKSASFGSLMPLMEQDSCHAEEPPISMAAICFPRLMIVLQTGSRRIRVQAGPALGRKPASRNSPCRADQ